MLRFAVYAGILTLEVLDRSDVSGDGHGGSASLWINGKFSIQFFDGRQAAFSPSGKARAFGDQFLAHNGVHSAAAAVLSPSVQRSLGAASCTVVLKLLWKCMKASEYQELMSCYVSL
ncbi:MAG: hypothetical protein V9H69_22105 [Anaerolineae bacterium]